MRLRYFFRVIVAITFWGYFVSGCSPSLSKKDEQILNSHNMPYQRKSDYREALERLGMALNKGAFPVVDVYQVKPILNNTGDQKAMPPDITEMVISSVNTISGNLLRVVPYDPDYIQNEAATNSVIPSNQPNNQQRTLPKFVVSGAITEFDEAISLKNNEVSVDAWSPLQIEGRDLDPDVELAFDRAERISRISVDFHLLDYQTLQFLPQQHVTNTILVVEIEKGRSWGFKIYGSGPTISGRITVRQGLQQAVRNLVDYSMTQLFSLHYQIPFWKIFAYDTGAQEQELLRNWRQQFQRNDMQTQIVISQMWLTKYDVGAIYLGNTLQRSIPADELGRFGEATQAFALKFLYQYEPRSPLIPYVEHGGFPQNADVLADLYMLLIEHLPL